MFKVKYFNHKETGCCSSVCSLVTTSRSSSLSNVQSSSCVAARRFNKQQKPSLCRRQLADMAETASELNMSQPTYQKDGRVRAVVLDLRAPLGGDVLEGGGGDDGETDEEDVRLRKERSGAYSVFRTGFCRAVLCAIGKSLNETPDSVPFPFSCSRSEIPVYRRI